MTKTFKILKTIFVWGQRIVSPQNNSINNSIPKKLAIIHGVTYIKHGNEFGDYWGETDFEGDCLGEYLCHIIYATTENSDKLIRKLTSRVDLENPLLFECYNDVDNYVMGSSDIEAFKEAFSKVLEEYKEVTGVEDIYIDWGDERNCCDEEGCGCPPEDMRIQGIEVIELDVEEYGLEKIAGKILDALERKDDKLVLLGKLTIATKEDCELTEYSIKGISGPKKLFEETEYDSILNVLNQLKLSMLTLDIDLYKINDLALLYSRMLELEQKFGRDNIRVFKSAEGYHVYVKLDRIMHFNELLKLREYYLDDPGRIKYDRLIYSLTKTPAYTNMLFRVKYVNGKLVHTEKSITWEEFIEEIHNSMRG